MKFFESVFNAFLSREQRERVNQSKWDKSVAQAARELGLDTPTQLPTPPPTPRLSQLNTAIPTSQAMMPSLSSSSTNTTASSNGPSSPCRSRPSTSYSTSPRPEFRRHTSITREPISYDALINSTKTTKPRRASQDAAPATHQLLYPLPPLGPMEGIGKYRRSVDVTDSYLDEIQRNTIAALQPLIVEDDRTSRFRRDTTTPPRAYSVSPPMEHQIAFECDLERLAGILETTAAAQTDPIIEEFEDIPSPAVKSLRPVRVSRRRAPSGRERNRAAAKVGAIQRGIKNSRAAYKQPVKVRREPDMSASMETLVSGEE